MQLARRGLNLAWSFSTFDCATLAELCGCGCVSERSLVVYAIRQIADKVH